MNKTQPEFDYFSHALVDCCFKHTTLLKNLLPFTRAYWMPIYIDTLHHSFLLELCYISFNIWSVKTSTQTQNQKLSLAILLVEFLKPSPDQLKNLCTAELKKVCAFKLPQHARNPGKSGNSFKRKLPIHFTSSGRLLKLIICQEFDIDSRCFACWSKINVI